MREPRNDGHGIKVEKGDQFILPQACLQMSANPLTGTVNFTRYGLDWFTQSVFVEDMKSVEDIDQLLENSVEYAGMILKGSNFLADLGLDNEQDAEEATRRVEESPTNLEFWAILVDTFSAIVKEALVAMLRTVFDHQRKSRAFSLYLWQLKT